MNKKELNKVISAGLTASMVLAPLSNSFKVVNAQTTENIYDDIMKDIQDIEDNHNEEINNDVQDIEDNHNEDNHNEDNHNEDNHNEDNHNEGTNNDIQNIEEINNDTQDIEDNRNEEINNDIQSIEDYSNNTVNEVKNTKTVDLLQKQIFLSELEHDTDKS